MRSANVAVFLCMMSVFWLQSQTTPDPLLAENPEKQSQWVDSVYNAMTLDERIGQLFMVQAFSNKEKSYNETIESLIRDYHIGGIIFTKGGPVRQAELTNAWQELSKTKMLIALDAEWGLSMRLDSTFAYPYNMAMGAVQNNDLIEAAGKRIGEHCKRLGVHVNFGPVVDVNTNPDNPIIGNRSFGENKMNVTEKAMAYTRGLQSAGILANAKHFPGHGDTDQDSHKTLPTVSFDKSRLDSIELYPYRRMFGEGLASVMVAHLNVPALERKKDMPTSLSENVVTDLLKEEMSFKGLIFTDALGMKGVSQYGKAGDTDVQAFLAGNDILLMSEDVPEAVASIKSSLAKGKITAPRLEHSVKKILKAKYKVGLNRYQPVSIDGIAKDLHTADDDVLYKEIMENAITLVRNDRQLVPVRDLEERRIAYVKMGDGDHQPFLSTLKKYTKVDFIRGADLADLLERLKPYETVIIGFHRDTDTPWKAAELTDTEKTWLYEISRLKDVILDVFVKPYALKELKSIGNIESLVVSYQNDPLAQIASAEVIFGAVKARGILPVTVNEWMPENLGYNTNSLSRLGYSFPEAVGMDGTNLKRIDSVINRAIKTGVTPSAQILIARRGRVIYNKSFGRFDYAQEAERVRDSNIYDLASLTKILATLPVIMQLTERGEISLESRLGEMLPDLKGSNKENLRLIEVLSHYARLKPWLPFYMYTLDDGTKKPSDNYYRMEPDADYNVRIADELYMRGDYQDSIIKIIKESDLLKVKQYRYSDLPYFFLQRFIERKLKKPLDEVVQENFYRPLGMSHTTYNPLEKFKKGEIVPSEVDDYYRYQTLQGYVHDMAAAMLGGVGGHAGLFSNADDVAKIMQMYLQKGYYGGERFFTSQTLDKFNTCYYCEEDNRRGVGFDKPQLGEAGPTCGCVSMTSFGHSGFTGTYAWADPEEDLIYIFLSNRTFPSMENRKLITEGTRTVIQEIIYDSILN
ncbi:glycoside hydrolase family 3 N-terminal domain-containing protein [Robertkochia flava]|uniref:glycoside hydrolase family 3 N-terminal domain-containing protein n=1 Tax=Robertkochia flava TaxID=3447986 RepID=UPI001CCEEF6E|nr:glycoside hydrolase family 3 N-terminal domain-containing protein [Robertkochia marina]